MFQIPWHFQVFQTSGHAVYCSRVGQMSRRLDQHILTTARRRLNASHVQNSVTTQTIKNILSLCTLDLYSYYTKHLNTGTDHVFTTLQMTPNTPVNTADFTHGLSKVGYMGSLNPIPLPSILPLIRFPSGFVGWTSWGEGGGRKLKLSDRQQQISEFRPRRLRVLKILIMPLNSPKMGNFQPQIFLNFELQIFSA